MVIGARSGCWIIEPTKGSMLSIGPDHSYELASRRLIRNALVSSRVSSRWTAIGGVLRIVCNPQIPAPIVKRIAINVVDQFTLIRSNDDASQRNSAVSPVWRSGVPNDRAIIVARLQQAPCAIGDQRDITRVYDCCLALGEWHICDIAIHTDGSQALLSQAGTKHHDVPSLLLL